MPPKKNPAETPTTTVLQEDQATGGYAGQPQAP
jgi:hypothetical protein